MSDKQLGYNPNKIRVMKARTVKQLIPAQKVNMGGHLLDQPLPTQKIEQIDPFLLIHHWDSKVPANRKQQDVGVGPHPHRGFSPVTFIYKGSIHHQDSMGNNAIVDAGGTQWMHAGRGVIHSERPAKELAENGGDQEIIQFWVNTPAKQKMDQPYYLPLSKEDTPKIVKDKATIEVVAGKLEGLVGPAKTQSPQTLLRVEAQAGADFQIELDEQYNTIVYVLNGKVNIDGVQAGNKEMFWLNNDGDHIHLKVHADSRIMILSGEPIGEKVSQYGPFVMNTQTEIMEALRDAQMGKMGVLIEDFD